MKNIKEEEFYEFKFTTFEGEEKLVVYEGKLIQNIIGWYQTVIKNKDVKYIKIQGGAIIDEETFNLILRDYVGKIDTNELKAVMSHYQKEFNEIIANWIKLNQ